LGFRFAPRIRNLADTRLYSPEAPLIGGTVNRKQITGHRDEILRLASSIKSSTARSRRR
jgi:TnpA family transposase